MKSIRENHLERLKSLNISQTHPHFLIYRPLIDALKHSFSKYLDGKVLDIGCGNKPYSSLFPSKVTEYIGCDIVQSSESRVDVICYADSIPLEDETFDSVISTQTIEHVGNFSGMLKESYRLLKCGGYFIVSGPMYWPLHEEPYDYHRFTKYGFWLELNKAGFEITETIPNGGKWALLGQVIFHTLPKFLIRPRFIKFILNRFFYHLDKKYPDFTNTMNYVVIAKKPV